MNLAKRLLSAAMDGDGPAPDTTLYVEDVFEMVLWTGNGAARTIPTQNDLTDGEWVIIWKRLDATGDNLAYAPMVSSNFNAILNSTVNVVASYVTALLSTGFSISSNGAINTSGGKYVAWLWKITPKFFDVVTWSGNSTNRTIPHNLGCLPGMIFVKSSSVNGSMFMYHRGMAATDPETDYAQHNGTSSAVDDATVWNDTAPTATEFSVGTHASVNATGTDYFAFLFAHDDTPEGIIQCGRKVYAAGSSVVLGWEPQFVFERYVAESTCHSWIYDVQRSFSEKLTRRLWWNVNNAEGAATAGVVEPHTKGYDENVDVLGTVMYMAIRRGLMRKPTDATKVFDVQLRTGTGATAAITCDWPPDMLWSRNRTGGTGRGMLLATRARNHFCVVGASTAAEAVGSPVFLDTSTFPWSTTDTKTLSIGTNVAVNESGVGYVDFLFRRAKGFFDLVRDIGTGVAHTIEHNLGVIPELIIRRCLTSTTQERVYVHDYPAAAAGFHSATGTLSASTMWNSTAATNAVFSVGTAANTNSNGQTFQSLLFASCPGVCKIGTYVSDGLDRNLAHDFASTPRMIFIKCISTTTDAVLYDIERGIVAGDDPFVAASSTAAETSSDTIDPYTGGITVLAGGAGTNVSGQTYVYMMIA